MALEADCWLCNFIFSKILIVNSYFWKTDKKEIEFLLQFTGSRKVLEKMPACVLMLPFWMGGSHFERTAPVLLFLQKSLILRRSWLENHIFKNFSSWSHFKYKLGMKILATSNQIRSVRCSWPPSSSWTVDLCQQKTLIALVLVKEVPGSLEINTVCNF